MVKARMEAFTDGVLAIIITIMVLEMKIPHGSELSSLKPLFPVIISYVLSSIYLGIYWNNHHHLMHAVKHINGRVLWSNLHLLFWLSLIPFVTGWMGENNFDTIPVGLYGIVMLMCAFAYYILLHSLTTLHGNDALIIRAVGNDRKGKMSIVLYFGGIIFSFIHPYLGLLLYIIVAGIWFIPDQRFEKKEYTA